MAAPESAAGCRACRATAGKIVPPGGVIYQDARWRLEHSLSPAPLASCRHLIPRAPGLPEDLRGPRIFELLRRAAQDGMGVPDAEAAAVRDGWNGPHARLNGQ